METNNGLSGGMFLGIGSGMLGLEMPLHPQPQQQPQNPQSVQNPHSLHHQQQHPQVVAYAHHETHVKQGYHPFGSKPKQISTISDEDEPGFTLDDGGSKRKASPWQRMKWTDNMVRLLIMAVYYIGDDQASSEGGNNNDPSGKKKGGGGSGGLLQKKGKWKSVSRAMMEKGFYVSPQQCEDKFNDLNKRYKRVNDILGKGTACEVVENQRLLESMDLSPKMKDEVKKLLNSKHLFFREMCAYHNSCGHVTQEVANETPPQMQQRCLHSSDNAQIGGNPVGGSTETLKLEESDDEESDDDDDESDGDDDDDDDETMDGHDEDQNVENSSRKRPRKGAVSPSMQQLSNEVTKVIQDGSKNSWEKKHWLKMKLMQLEEQQVSYQCEAFELEKQRLKWVKFSGKKEREMEKSKLENQRKRLENERMVLIVRQQELELVDMSDVRQHASNKRGDLSRFTS
ncbi:hypothetical protein Godav_020265 [Gossypium davidsonii]|uniref:Myb/SANT-like DNA-binding domain-containing protein n=1 Tax=Gossypium davidsonii TaxID=34287 RepID=A0A7J8R351_GOSDV|nr:hypothetical protein [Gossypium davidsonii]